MTLLFKNCHCREENLAKINRRVSDYKVDVRNPPRAGKKLLVLDVDYTIFGKWAAAERLHKPKFFFRVHLISTAQAVFIAVMRIITSALFSLW